MKSAVEVWRDVKKLKNQLNKVGKLLVWTKIYAAPVSFEAEAPYLVGIVKFEDGGRMPLQIVDCVEKELKINQKVLTVLRRVGKASAEGVIEYGIKVKPI